MVPMLNRSADRVQFSLHLRFRGILRGFHSRKLGIAGNDAAGEGKSVVCFSFWRNILFPQILLILLWPLEWTVFIMLQVIGNDMCRTISLSLDSYGFLSTQHFITDPAASECLSLSASRDSALTFLKSLLSIASPKMKRKSRVQWLVQSWLVLAG